MFVAERLLFQMVMKYGKHQVPSDSGTWYPQACKFLNLHHYLQSAFENHIIEITMDYKNKTE